MILKLLCNCGSSLYPHLQAAPGVSGAQPRPKIAPRGGCVCTDFAAALPLCPPPHVLIRPSTRSHTDQLRIDSIADGTICHVGPCSAPAVCKTNKHDELFSLHEYSSYAGLYHVQANLLPTLKQPSGLENLTHSDRRGRVALDTSHAAPIQRRQCGMKDLQNMFGVLKASPFAPFYRLLTAT